MFEQEQEEDKQSHVAIVKQQFKIPKTLWQGMPLLLSNVKLGKRQIREPTVFYVNKYDANTVTLCNMLSTGEPEPFEDEDGEIDLDDTKLTDKIEIIISRDDFYELQKPQGMQPGMPPPGGGLI